MINSKQHIILKMILCRRTEHVIKSWLEMPLIHILKNILKKYDLFNFSVTYWSLTRNNNKIDLALWTESFAVLLFPLDQ